MYPDQASPLELDNIEIARMILFMISKGGTLDNLEQYAEVLLKAFREENMLRKRDNCIGVGLIVTESELKYDINNLLRRIHDSADNKWPGSGGKVLCGTGEAGSDVQVPPGDYTGF